MSDLRPHLAALAAVLADAAEQALPALRGLAIALTESTRGPEPSKPKASKRCRATPRPTVKFSELDAARAARALRRAGYTESDK